MKKRTKQRANRRLKEEILELRDSCGVKDPTPYEAVKEMIREIRKNNEARRYQHGICADVN